MNRFKVNLMSFLFSHTYFLLPFVPLTQGYESDHEYISDNRLKCQRCQLLAGVTYLHAQVHQNEKSIGKLGPYSLKDH